MDLSTTVESIQDILRKGEGVRSTQRLAGGVPSRR